MKSLARLLINGTSACTGWLIGDDGHLMTNEHCVENSIDANNVTVEFMAEGNNCATDCRSWFGCPGVIEATSTNLVRVNSNLDYSLLQLPNNVSNQYGYLQLREDGANQNEQIYIPQHPGGWGKRIALESTNPNDTGGVARIFSLNEPSCSGTGNDIGYFADTQGGSSGSPVIGYNDNLVVALHHCGNCPNRGVPIQDIIDDLGNDIPNNAIPCTMPEVNDFTLVSSGPSCINYNWQTIDFGVQKNSSNSCSLSYLPENITEVEWQIIPSQPINITEDSGIYSCSTSSVTNSGVKVAFSLPNDSYVTTFRFRVKGVCWSDWSVGHYYMAQKCNYFNYSIYPNPANNQFTIKSEKQVKTETKNNTYNTSLQVVTQSGNVVLHIDTIDLIKGETIDVDHLRNGIYIIVVNNNGIIKVKN